jgi:putative tryptophan/tyrosine transport system substrate-binding protein
MANQIGRREFIATLGAAAAVWPLVAHAARIARIGIIDNSPLWDVFRQTLRDLGYLEGQNIAFEYRYAGARPHRLAAACAELVRRPVDLIATFGTPPTLAAKQATKTIPIVMIGIGDPVGAGIVSDLARPGGNITGNTLLGPDLAGKRLHLLKEVLPFLSRVAFLWNPDNASNPPQLVELEAAAQTLGMTLLTVPVRSFDQFESAFAEILREHVQALLMTADPLHQIGSMRIIDFLTSKRLPGMFMSREIVAAGGFMSYGASVPDLFRRGALYVHRILQGARPADLPVEEPTKFELVINLKTAKAIGLDVPATVLARADAVIE